MDKKLLIASVVLCALVVVFQQCSVGDSGGVGDLSQNSQGSNPDLPTVTVTNSALALSSTSNFSVDGNCDTKGHSAYTFVVRFLETGVSNPAVTSLNSTCTNGHYNLNITQSHLAMRSGYPGTLTIRISVEGSEGPAASVSITWTGTGTTTATSTGTSTGSTSTSTGTSTGTTTGGTGCPRTDGSCNMASDPFTAFGGGCCRSGGWWMCDNPAMPACSGGSSGGTSSTGTSTGTSTGSGANCPTTDGTCNMATDPFTAFGGGCCRDAGWWMCNNPSMPACP